MSDKIKSHHLDRKAILYVRQSSIHQVTHNQEGRLLQYAMRDRLCALGWREIEVVDDDLGRSAAGSAVRAGFERMVAEVWARRGELIVMAPVGYLKTDDQRHRKGSRPARAGGDRLGVCQVLGARKCASDITLVLGT